MIRRLALVTYVILMGGIYDEDGYTGSYLPVYPGHNTDMAIRM